MCDVRETFPFTLQTVNGQRLEGGHFLPWRTYACRGSCGLQTADLLMLLTVFPMLLTVPSYTTLPHDHSRPCYHT